MIISATIAGKAVPDTVDITFTTFTTASFTNASELAANPTTVVADGTANSIITLQAQDANGNNLTSGGLSVDMTQSGSATLSGVTDNNDGTYSATITNTVAEMVTISATINGSTVINTVSVNFTTGAATTTTSTLTASPTTVPADGSTTSTVTMQAKDANGNNLTAGGLTVTVEITNATFSNGSNITIMTDNGDGTYSATFTSTVIGSAYVFTSFGGIDMLDYATVSFVYAPQTINFKGLTYKTVLSPDTGKEWLDRNLGATQVATSSTDSASYGDYYQWGRAADGHESKTSGTTTTQATDISNAGSLFITYSISGGDWASVDVNGSARRNAWKDGGANDICPAGFSVPTEAELKADTTAATTTKITNNATAFSSFLKLPITGIRSFHGPIFSVDSAGSLWSSSSSGSSYSHGVSYGNSSTSFHRDYGRSVRCIKN